MSERVAAGAGHREEQALCPWLCSRRPACSKAGAQVPLLQVKRSKLKEAEWLALGSPTTEGGLGA